MLLRRRILVAVIVFASTATGSWFAQIHITHSPGGDFTWTMRAARDLVSGRDPYGYTPDPHHIPYPLPAVFVGLPFSIFSPAIGAALFFGASAGLLAFGIRETRRLLIFAAMPFWFALIWAQWTPLIVASAFIPALGAVLLIKPHIALPVFVTNFSRIRVYSCAIVVVATLIVYPRWPFVWVSQLSQYQNFFPILTFPFGPLLSLALIKWRERDAWFLLLVALLPERAFYDSFTLWLIPKSRRELAVTVGLSWGAFIWRMFNPNANLALLSVAFLFLPMLVVILSRSTSLNNELTTNRPRAPRIGRAVEKWIASSTIANEASAQVVVFGNHSFSSRPSREDWWECPLPQVLASEHHRNQRRTSVEPQSCS